MSPVIGRNRVDGLRYSTVKLLMAVAELRHNHSPAVSSSMHCPGNAR